MTETESFERAFVATTYLLGRRDAITDGLALPSPAAARIAQRIGEGERSERAQRLAVELAPIVVALDARRLR